MRRCWRNILVFLLLLGGLGLTGCAGGTARQMSITSTPPGALVYLNGEELGMTPLESTIEEREGDFSIYEFHLIKEDYIPERRAFKEEFYYQTVRDVVPETLHFELKKRRNHEVFVTSEPPGATVLLDGEQFGITPVTLIIKQSIKEPRPFSIYASKDGYLNLVTTIREVVSKEDKEIFILPETVHFDMVRQE